jgi:hypothetical protein
MKGFPPHLPTKLPSSPLGRLTKRQVLIRWMSDDKFKWVDEETVYKIWLIDSISVGDAAIPHTPPLGKAASPDPTIFASQRVSGKGIFACVIRNRISVDCDLALCGIGRDFNWLVGHLAENESCVSPLQRTL